MAIVALLALIGGHFAGWCCILTCPSATSAIATAPHCHEDAGDGPAVSAGHDCASQITSQQLIADRTTAVTSVPALIVLPWRPAQALRVIAPLAFSMSPADTSPPITSPLPLRI